MRKIFMLFVIISLAVVVALNSCAPAKEITEKSGAQLWGENCNRCHNAPSMEQYNQDQWGIIGTHMKLKAGLSPEEVNKIISFLQGNP